MAWLGRCSILVGAAAFLVCRAFGQESSLQTPEGSRHFIVLVDAGLSMVTLSKPPAAPDTKRKNLADAKHRLADLLFSVQAGHLEPWYRQGMDRVSVIQYGFDPKPNSNLTAARLAKAHLDEDYARRVVSTDKRLSRKRFLGALTPKARTHLSVREWALPLGLSAAAVPGVAVQDSYVVFLNDAAQNDVLLSDKSEWDSKLSALARNRLLAKQKLVKESVRFGSLSPLLEERVGKGPDSVVISIFRVSPRSAGMAYGENPLDSLRLAPTAGGLSATLDVPKPLVGKPAALSLQAGEGDVSSRLVLAEHSKVGLKPLGGIRALARLVVTDALPNAILGKQAVRVVFEHSVLMPEGLLIRSIFEVLLLLAGLAAVGFWFYYHAVLARHFQLWLPGYVSSFRLPALSQRVASRHVVRIPVEIGDVAVAVILPSPLIRQIFYRDATLHWDSKLIAPTAQADEHSAKLTVLRTVTKFVCKDRPRTSGEFELIIERPSRKGGNQRAKINVRFLALPNGNRPSIE